MLLNCFDCSGVSTDWSFSRILQPFLESGIAQWAYDTEKCLFCHAVPQLVWQSCQQTVMKTLLALWPTGKCFWVNPITSPTLHSAGKSKCVISPHLGLCVNTMSWCQAMLVNPQVCTDSNVCQSQCLSVLKVVLTEGPGTMGTGNCGCMWFLSM